MNIGDLFWTLRGDGARLQKDAKTEGDKAGATLGKRIQAGIQKSWSGAEIGKGLVQGLGLAGGLGAAQLVTRGVQALTDVLNDSAQAALAEEDSIGRLDGALRQNARFWDGNKDAIEEVIKSRMRLGFSDDEQRESLVRLLPVYKDVNKALDIQRAAMDLARFKKISLADATLELITIEAGQYRSLKKLIGSTKDITTAEQALEAVHNAVGDAAEDAAKMNSGKLLASQVEIGEQMEELGKYTLPVLVEGTKAAATVAKELAGNLEGLSKAGSLAGDVMENLGIKSEDAAESGFDLVGTARGLIDVVNPTRVSNTLGNFLGTIEQLGVDTRGTRFQLNQMGFDLDKEVIPSFGDARTAADAFERRVAASGAGAVVAIDTVGDASGDMADDVKKDTRTAAEKFHDMVESLKADADDLIGKAFDPIIDHNKLVATNIEIAATKASIASGKLKGDQLRDAHDTLDGLRRDQAEYVLSLAAAGQTQSKAYQDAMAQLKTQIKNATGPAKIALNEILNKILAIEQAGKTVPINIVVTGKNRLDFINNKLKERAAGGPVSAGTPYVVGEKRAEIFVPDVSGRIIPRTGALPAMAAAGGGGGDTFQLNMPVQKAPDPFETVNQHRRMADFYRRGKKR